MKTVMGTMLHKEGLLHNEEGRPKCEAGAYHRDMYQHFFAFLLTVDSASDKI
ncbi:hypothetical protein IMSAGC013_01810 [Lachnospiraceae bacterium]|nr:hypothetical protein IMSAGC013_01810 [Lachnospiraceae bacterium]